MSEVGIDVASGANILALSLVVWLVRHMFTRTIPRLVDDFKELTKEQRESWQTEISAQRASWQTEIKAQRETCQSFFAAQRAHFERQEDRLIAQMSSQQESIDSLQTTILDKVGT